MPDRGPSKPYPNKIVAGRLDLIPAGTPSEIAKQKKDNFDWVKAAKAAYDSHSAELKQQQ